MSAPLLRIGITGASGLIGSALRSSLSSAGHDIYSFVRRTPRHVRELAWDPYGAGLDPAALRDLDAVVHLSGAGIADRRWTSRYRQTLIDSRVRTSQAVARALEAAHAADGRQRRLIAASGINYYGADSSTTYDERGPKGSGFLADLCERWESATRTAPDAATVVNVRNGLVVAPGAPFVKKQLPLFRLGLGGPLGSGDQSWPLVTLRDAVSAYTFLLADDDGRRVSGPVNLCSPVPTTQGDFAAELGRQLNRPTVLPAPKIALRLALGDFADEGILAGPRARPGVLLEHGFAFNDQTLPEIVGAALGRY